MRSVSRSPERGRAVPVPPASPGVPTDELSLNVPAQGAAEDDNAVRMFKTPPRPGRAAATESPNPTVEDDVTVEDAAEMSMADEMSEGAGEGAGEGVAEGVDEDVDEAPQGGPMAAGDMPNEPPVIPVSSDKRLVSQGPTPQHGAYHPRAAPHAPRPTTQHGA